MALGPNPCLAVALLGLGFAPTALAAQHSSGPPAAGTWNITLFGGLTQHLSQDRLHSAFGVGLGVRRRLGGHSGLSLELAYLPLGKTSETTAYAPILQPTQAGTLLTERSRQLLRLGLSTDLALTAGPIRPTLLFGLSGARFRGVYHTVLRDSTGTVISSTDLSAWYSGVGGYFGIGVGLPRLARQLTPMVEARFHGFALRSEDGWSGLPVLTLGLTLTH